jgi:ribosomal protein S18 acetylase RimI-like enzyme
LASRGGEEGGGGARCVDRVSLRAAIPQDDGFLLALFADTRAEEFAMLPLPTPQKDALIQMQARAQELSYFHRYPHARQSIVVVGDDRVGRLFLGHRGDECRLLDISLLAQWRGMGIGTHVLKGLLEQTDAANHDVVLNVFGTNPARRLYERLGFQLDAVTSNDSEGSHTLLRRQARGRRVQ